MNQEKPFGVRSLAVGAVLFLAAGFFVGTEAAPHVPWVSYVQASDAPDGADLTPFFKAWQLLDQNFAPATAATSTATTTITAEEKVWGAISGLASSYGDPYTVFLPPQDKTNFETQVQGNFGGVGMEIDNKDGVLTVIAPLKDTPAFRAGIKTGDLVLKIDGVETMGMQVEDAVSKIRGPEGTDVTITFSRDGETPYDVKLTREQINLPTVDTKLRPDGVFVIQVYTFNAAAPEKFRNAVREFANSGSDKMIIDLRGNPGGYLEVAVDMASWFLPVGKPVVTTDYSGKQPSDVARSRGYDVFTDKLKLAILIDGGSASASEIFAGALHDYGKATLIGDKSFGKGSVQQLFDVTDKSSLKITIARWLTPNGTSISHKGIEPDIKATLSKDDIAKKYDSQMERAVQFLLSGK